MKLAIGYLLLAIGVTAVAPRAAVAQDMGIEKGSRGPSAKVYTLDGKEADLGQYVGKTPVLIEFWATWCPNSRSSSQR
jgi:thioredoxin-like negative regulator of GroEL